MVVFLKNSLLTVILGAMTVWLIHYGILQHIANHPHADLEKAETKNFRYRADFFYDAGSKAWYTNDHESAADYFKKALQINRLYIDAWIGLAQTKTDQGETNPAAEILRFTNRLTQNVARWKWSQLMLARELDMEDIFFQNINFLIPYRQFHNEAFHLLDLHLNGETGAVLQALEDSNVPHYLHWLMRWRRTEDCFPVWDVMTDRNLADDAGYEKYLGFLVSQKEIRRASDLRKQYTGHEGMNNPGFESPLSNKAFGWRTRLGNNWEIRRVSRDAFEGNHVLQVGFSGVENIHFYHLSQIVPVEPGKDYTIGFRWKSHHLTTDQRPFVEVIGMDCKKTYWKSEMVPISTDWRQEMIFISVPENCHGVTVRLKRNKSNRFDNKIRGTLWLDHFSLESVSP